MSRKDYQAIADAIRAAAEETESYRSAEGDNYANGGRYGINVAAIHIANALAADNPRFDRARFLAACMVS